MNLRTPLIVLTASVSTMALNACGADHVSGVNDTVDTNTEVSTLTNDPSVAATTVPTEQASIPAETLPPATAAP